MAAPDHIPDVQAAAAPSLPHVAAPSVPRVTATELFRAHGRAVWRVLRSFGVADRDLPDLLQEVFLVVHRNLAGFDGRSQHTTWLYGIAFRVASAHRRRARFHREQLEAQPPEPVDLRRPDDELEQKRKLERLWAVLEELPEEQRAAFVLHDIEELPMPEVAAALECPVQTAYSRARVARQHVQRAFRREDRLQKGGTP